MHTPTKAERYGELAEGAKRSADVYVENHGTVILLEAVTARAKIWVVRHAPGVRRMGRLLALKPLAAWDLTERMESDGLTVR